MRLNSGCDKKKARVEMLPLIDVVFLLLVFFIYAMVSMVQHRGININLPGAATTTLSTDDYIAITLNANNELFLNGQPTTQQTIATEAQALLDQSPRPIFIEGDEKADFGRAIELLDQLRKAGIEEISFSCEKTTP